MIVAEAKSMDEIQEMLDQFKNILVLGCGTCVTVCMSGGQKEAEMMAMALSMARKAAAKESNVQALTILRQCDPEFVEQIKEQAGKFDVILSMACGAGVQGLTEWLNDIPVLPAMNTRFIGMTDGQGTWTEVCAACGDCVLSMTGGICPVTSCAKGLLNGPCGGTKNAMCEISPDVPCAWVRIYERMRQLGRLNELKKPIAPKKWSRSQKPGRYSSKAKE